MRLLISILILVLLIPSAAKAQETSNVISYVTVAANLTLDTINSFRAEDRGDAFKKQALRTAITIGVSEIIKRVVHETRPDGSDNMSFPSEHSALSCVSVNVREGKKFAVEFPIAFGTMLGRVQANKHYWWDVLSGCGIGLAAGLVTR